MSLPDFDEHMLQLSQPLLLACLRLETGHDQQLGALDVIAREYAGELHVSVLDLSASRRFRNFFNIMGTPTYIILQNGQELDRMLGKADESALHSFIHQVLKLHH